MPDSESFKYPRKRLVDYIFEGGIKGRFFIDDCMGFLGEEIEPPNSLDIYKVIKLDLSRGVGAKVRYPSYVASLTFEELCFGVEATPEEIQQFREAKARAEEMRLAKAYASSQKGFGSIDGYDSEPGRVE